MSKYEVVEYTPTRTIVFYQLETAERYLDSIMKVDINNLYFIERDGEAIK